MKQIKGIQLGAMLAVMLFLGVVMAPVVSAQTDTLIQDKKLVRTQGGTGLGSHIDSYLSGKGVINSSTVWISSPVLRYLRMYNVKHSKSGKFNAKVNRLPIGSYELGVIFPKGMSVYPHNATGMTYTGRWMKGYNSYWFKKDGWFVGSVKLKVPVKFKAGYGSHGIITAGGFSNGVLGSIMTGISGGIGLLLGGTLNPIFVGTLITVVAASGANVDFMYFNER